MRMLQGRQHIAITSENPNAFGRIEIGGLRRLSHRVRCSNLAGRWRYDSKLSNPWLNCPGLPRPVAAVLAALRFRDLNTALLTGLGAAGRREALAYADAQGLT